MLKLDEYHVYGGKFCPEDGVVFLKACGIGHDVGVSGLVNDRGSQFGVGINFGAVIVYPVSRVP